MAGEVSLVILGAIFGYDWAMLSGVTVLLTKTYQCGTNYGFRDMQKDER